jgi:ribulose-phosphate 3-epimerase
MLQVIPGILETDFAEIKRKVVKVAPYVEYVQIDLADGELVENETFADPSVFSGLPLRPKRELHMMIENPVEQVDDWIEVGFSRIIAQVEGIGDPEAFIEAVTLHSVEVGLALDIATPVAIIEPYLDSLDVVLLMSIEAGFSGQEFVPQVLNKIREVRKISDLVPIEVDGGINLETARQVEAAGASRVVSTSFIFGSDDISGAIQKLASM